MPFSKGTSENTILFFEGGHNHDGQSSALIDVSRYSIYDFVVGKVGSSTRQTTQQRNFDNLKTVISNIITTDILGPAGVRLAPNSVQSVNIAAGAVTASELAANIVLVNNIISSGNYVPNVSGWAINSNGFAEFDIAVIRGQIQADSIYINSFNYWASNGIFNVGTADNFMFFNGTNLELTGTVIATAGQIAGWQISGDNLETGGNFAGSMQLGEFTGTNGAAGVFIEGAADGNNQYGIAKLTGDYLSLANTNTGNELYAFSSGIQYTGTHNNSNSVGNYSYSFYYNGTNVYARLYNVANNSYFDVCLTNCGAGTTSATTTTAGTTTAAPGTTTTTVAPTTTTTTSGPPPEQGTTTSTAATTTTTCPPGCTPPCPDGFICSCGFCIG
jgi:hypothetical protein